MALLDPGFAAQARAAAPATTIGRLRVASTDPVVDAAIDALLAAAEVEVVEVDVPAWGPASASGVAVLYREAWHSDRAVYERAPDRVGASVRERLDAGRAMSEEVADVGRSMRRPWRDELDAVLARVQVLALPVLRELAPRLDAPPFDTRTTCVPVNLGGHPALALPAPTGGPLPASLQLVGLHGSEAQLCATALVLEAAARSR
jgi:aspartyl-tRNA(Asn)/glutamyl-tRNA(Gln) amidotransferase subunit A